MFTNLRYIIVCVAFLFSIQFSYSQSPSDCTKPGNLSFNFLIDTIELGDTVPVDFLISGFEDMISFQLPITYNPSNMEFVKCEQQFLPNFTCNDIFYDSSAPGQLKVFWSAEDISAPVSLNMEEVMFTLHFVITGVSETPDSIKIENRFDNFRFEFIKAYPVVPSATSINDFCQDGGEFFVECPEVTAFISECGGIADGSANFELTLCGGAAPFEYLIVSSTGEIIGTGNIPNNLTPLEIDGLDPGTPYNIEVRDVNGNLITTEEIILDVKEPINVEIDLSNALLSGSGTVPCAEGPQSFVRLEALVTPPAFYLYEWNGGQLGQQLRSATPGDYSVTVQDIDTGCKETANYTLNQPDSIKITIDNLTGPLCSGPLSFGSISLTISGGLPEFNGEQGVYSVRFEDPVTGISQGRASRSDGTINYSLPNSAQAGSEWSITVDDYAFGFQGNCPSGVTVFSIPDCITMSVDNEEPEDTEPEEMESETPFLDSYPWLDSEISVDDCASLQITEYDLGAFSFIYLSDGRLYFQDGTFYCQSSDSRDCLALYELTESSVTTVWDCGEERGNQNENEEGNENENQNENGLPISKYPWITQAAFGFDCGALKIQEYDLGAFSFLFLQDDDQAGLYFEDGTFYCEDTDTRDCRVLYNLTDAGITNSWTCEGNENENENEDQNENENENESESTDFFSEYSWITDVISPDCSDGSIKEFKDGIFSYFLIDNGAEEALYFQDGTLYCQQTDTYNCVAAYGFDQAVRSYICDGTSVIHAEERSILQYKEYDSSISISPNPSTGMFTIFHPTETSEIFIFDLTGKLIKQVQSQHADQSKIDLSDQESGLFIIKMGIGNLSISKKLVKL